MAKRRRSTWVTRPRGTTSTAAVWSASRSGLYAKEADPLTRTAKLISNIANDIATSSGSIRATNRASNSPSLENSSFWQLFSPRDQLRAGFNGRLDDAQNLMITVRIVLASALMAGLAWLIWKGLDSVLGRSLLAQIVSVGLAIALAGAFYAKTVLMMQIPEARQIEELIVSRIRR